ncbi:MAG: hypothetical protein V3U60_16140 [Gammaproteobacteria bacterium]
MIARAGLPAQAEERGDVMRSVLADDAFCDLNPKTQDMVHNALVE